MKCPKTGKTPFFQQCYECKDSWATADDLGCNLSGERNGQITEYNIEKAVDNNESLQKDLDEAMSLLREVITQRDEWRAKAEKAEAR